MNPPEFIAHYRIVSKLGEGGMGAVYRATDTKLGRDVAIKVLPETFAADPDRLARFAREAKVLAQLNHPNVAAIYGVEDRALVLELVDGSAPAGPMSAEAALSLIEQLIDALEYAHDKGVVHRDLKPANLKVTPDGRLKVLDFGLAKALVSDAAAPSSASAANSPTLTMRATEAGLLLGTAAYMSPEQARGQNVDRRSDIWSFGAIVYELLAGKQLFAGPTVSDVLVAVLTHTPDLSGIPPRFHRLLQVCLAREARERMSHISGARLLLREEPVGARVPVPEARAGIAGWWKVGAALLFGSLVVLLAVTYLGGAGRGQDAVAGVIRFSLSAPEEGTFAATRIALSRDGRQLAFVAYSKSRPQGAVWVRGLDLLEPRALAGTENASAPFWSPDGKSIGFWSRGALRRVDVNGGPVQLLCDTRPLSPMGNAAGVWDTDGTIVFPAGGSGLYRVPETGGSPVRFLEPDRAKGESSNFYPVLLRDDPRHLLFLAQGGGSARMVWSSMDGKERKDLGLTSYSFDYAPPARWREPGHLLFLVEGVLTAQPVAPATFAPAGAAFRVADRISTGSNSGGFAVSPAGTLAYRRGYSTRKQKLQWVDRTGKVLSSVGPVSDYRNAVVSNDQRHLLVTQTVSSEMVRSLWLIDLVRGVPTRFSPSGEGVSEGVFSPDGRKVAYSRSQNRGIVIRDRTSAAAEEPMQFPMGRPVDWSRDGRYLLIALGAAGNSHLATVDVSLPPGKRTAVDYLPETPDATQAQFAPETGGAARWVAYTSTESGQRLEVYVQSFPAGKGKVQVSSEGGSQPRWRADGKELFYIAADGQLMAVDMRLTEAGVQAGIPRALFASPGRQEFSGLAYQYNVAPDGQRFLFNTPWLDDTEPETITVEWNWLAGVKK